MLLGVVGFTLVVLFVLAVSTRSSPVPAGAEVALPPVGDPRPPRLAPSPRQAIVRMLGFSLAVWSSSGLFWLAGSMPDLSSRDLTAARATDVRYLHADIVVAVMLIIPAYVLLISTGIMDYRANRGRARARAFGPDSILVGAYRSIGLRSMATIFAVVSLYVPAVLAVVNHIVS